MSESARSILKHLYEEGRMTEYQYQKIDRNLKEPKHGEWIPCSERLPDKEDHYLMTVISRGGIKTFVGFFIKEINDFEMFQYRYGEVLAWMPLPKPYKAGDDV